MSASLAVGLLVMLALVGVGVIIAGLRPVDPGAAPLPRSLRRLQDLRRGARTRTAQRQRTIAALAATVGLVLAVLTGWVVAIVALPLAVLGLPTLLQTPAGKHSIKRLEALEDWTRSLSGVLSVGVGLEQAIQATLSPSTPQEIRPEVATLVARLRARWSTQDALRAFAHDLNDRTADEIIFGLIMAAGNRGDGLARMLEDTAARASEQVRNRMRVEADLASPRFVARALTMLSLGAVAVMVLFSRNYLTAYSSPGGQLVVAVLLSIYAAALLAMRRMTTPKPLPRLLEDDSSSAGRTSERAFA